MSDGIYVGGLLNGTPTQYVRFEAGGVTVLSPTKSGWRPPRLSLRAISCRLTGTSPPRARLRPTGDVVGDGVSLHDHVHGGVTAGGGNTAPEPMKTLLLVTDKWDLCLDANGNIASAEPPYARAQDVASALRLFAAELWYDTSLGFRISSKFSATPRPLRTFRAIHGERGATRPRGS
jgi:hypothetical protein